jgi:hypothetical protein
MTKTMLLKVRAGFYKDSKRRRVQWITRSMSIRTVSLMRLSQG